MRRTKRLRSFASGSHDPPCWNPPLLKPPFPKRRSTQSGIIDIDFVFNPTMRMNHHGTFINDFQYMAAFKHHGSGMDLWLRSITLYE